MAASRSQEPLLRRPESQNSGDQGVEEEDALLTGQRTGKQGPATAKKTRRWREIGLFVWALVATAAVIVLAVVWQHNQQQQPFPDPGDGRDGGGDDGGGGGGGAGNETHSDKRNLIFMVSDGMGPTSLSLTRTWRQFTQQQSWDNTLFLDKHLIGQSRTRSTSSLITDSAAGATAFSCGAKSYNGAISVLPSFEPCGSVMEAAKRMGYTTGLVVTTRITDATPAVFASHVRKREYEDDIALQMIGETHPLGRMVDLMMGGGRCHFLPNTTEGSCRHDNTNVTKVAHKNFGWNYLSTREDFDGLESDTELPLLALFAKSDFPYEIDRRMQSEMYPSLEEMTKKALGILSTATKDSDQGFFIMIEGSRIDHAGHANDPAAQVHEVLAYDRAVSAVFDFIEQSDVPTLMVGTSDHETGGLATARQLHEEYPKYLWYPSVLANVSRSASNTSHEYHDYLYEVTKQLATDTSSDETTQSENLNAFLKNLLKQSLGIHDPTLDEMETLITRPEISSYTFADMVSRRAQTGWSTHGHSAADVNIYSSDPDAADALRGNHENTEIGKFLRTYLDLDDEVEKVTAELRDHSKVAQEAFLGKAPEVDERLDGQDHLDHYHGDHKTRRCEVCGI